MEDAIDALKMAFSVFVFIVALTIVFAMFSQAKEVTDMIMSRADSTYFAQYEFPNENTNGREVGIETIIPTLYRYNKEKFAVDIVTNETEKFDEEIERLVYTRGEGYKDYEDLYPNGISWLAKPNIDTQKRISAYIAGRDENVNGTVLSKYKDTNLNDCRDGTFIETFEQKNNGDKKYEGQDGSTIYLVKGTTKLYITYDLQQ